MARSTDQPIDLSRARHERADHAMLAALERGDHLVDRVVGRLLAVIGFAGHEPDADGDRPRTAIG